MDSKPVTNAQTWRTTHGDMTDEEWDLISDLVAPYWKPGRMGRPVTVERRDIVNAIFYVVATGCQWRALPECYPNWNTVHRYHLTWSRDGTWEKIAGRLAQPVRQQEGQDAEPSAGVVDARTVRGTSTVPATSGVMTPGRRSRVVKHSGLSTPSGCCWQSPSSPTLRTTPVAPRSPTPPRPGVEPVPPPVVRRRVQKDLHQALPYPPRRRRSREPYPPTSVRGPPQTLDHRTNLVVADEQPPPPSRLRT